MNLLRNILGLGIFCLTPVFAQSADDLLEQGREAYINYDFTSASRLYNQAKAKAKKPSAEFNERYNFYENQLNMAKNFLQRVEQIEIIDSLNVERTDFFKYYRLPKSAGSLRGNDELPYPNHYVDYVFVNEGEDFKLWSQPDSIGYRLMESSLLTDGSWSEPSALPDLLGAGADAIYPFMMADGVTLYYADNGANSIGGYDIMVATRDASDGSFLQPSNLGFPYNSPFDDYLLAIDELNGVGWWATDRNQLDNQITIYVFKTNDLRKNYDADADDVVAYARIDDISETWPEEADYSELLATIKAINPDEKVKRIEFNFAVGDKLYTSYDQLPDHQAQAAVKRYFGSKENFEKEEMKLLDLRKEYHKHSSYSLKTEILKMESQLEKDRVTLEKIRQEAIKKILNP